jgi:hypothetical protein
MEFGKASSLIASSGLGIGAVSSRSFLVLQPPEELLHVEIHEYLTLSNQ